MNGLKVQLCALVVALSPPVLLRADVVVRRWGKGEIAAAKGAAGIVRFDLSGLPAGATVHRADLRIYRTADVDGRTDAAGEHGRRLGAARVAGAG